jgi:hypothetical protein
VPITDNEPALRGESVNQPPTGARRRTSSFTLIAAVTITTTTSAAIQVSTGNTLVFWPTVLVLTQLGWDNGAHRSTEGTSATWPSR